MGSIEDMETMIAIFRMASDLGANVLSVGRGCAYPDMPESQKKEMVISLLTVAEKEVFDKKVEALPEGNPLKKILTVARLADVKSETPQP